MTVRQDAPSDRHHMRVDLNALVTIDGQPCELNDLSLGGIGLASISPDLGRQGAGLAALVLPCQGFELKLSIRVAPVWRQDGKARAGYRFLELTRAQTETLRFVVESTLEGKLLAVDGVIQTAGAPATRKAPAVAQVETSRDRLRRRLSFSATVAAGLLLVSAAGTLLYDRVTILETKLAAVSAPTLDIKSPGDGTLDGTSVKVGMNVGKGDVVFEVSDNELKGDIDIAGAELERDRVRMELLAKQAGLTGSVGEETRLTAKSARKVARSRDERAKAELLLAERRVERSKELAAGSFIAKDVLEADEKLVLEARYEAAQAAKELEDAASRLRLLDKGFDAGLAHVANMTQPRLEESVALARADVGVREARLRALNLRREDLIVRSPCDCVVESVFSTTGEHAKKGDLVVQLRARESLQLTVEALVNQDDAERIAIGSMSEIVLPVGRAQVAGKVIEINRVPKHAKRTGLPDRSPDLHQYAAVTIAPAQALTGVELGMPVTVRLRSNTLLRIAQSVAAAFGGHETIAYAQNHTPPGAAAAH